ncbi:MAG: thiamine phosphate synthase, partial [Bacteroidales bacterium]
TTKEKLSPILGIDGYNRIVKECKKNNIDIPIHAIGGIRLDDLKSLKSTNIFGLAISSIILESSSPVETTKEIINNWK